MSPTTHASTRPASTPRPPAPDAVRAAAAPVVQDNRPAYLAWGLAWLVGYGAFALSSGPDPLVPMPAIVPLVLLGAGVLGALVVSALGIARDARGVTGPAALQGTLFGAAWVIGFVALYLLITALGGQVPDEVVSIALWPAGSALVVGMLYLMGGALYRDLLQFGLGTWLALVGTAAVFAGTTGQYALTAVVGSAGYVTAAALEGRRRAAATA